MIIYPRFPIWNFEVCNARFDLFGLDRVTFMFFFFRKRSDSLKIFVNKKSNHLMTVMKKMTKRYQDYCTVFVVIFSASYFSAMVTFLISRNAEIAYPHICRPIYHFIRIEKIISTQFSGPLGRKTVDVYLWCWAKSEVGFFRFLLITNDWWIRISSDKQAKEFVLEKLEKVIPTKKYLHQFKTPVAMHSGLSDSLNYLSIFSSETIMHCIYFD